MKILLAVFFFSVAVFFFSLLCILNRSVFCSALRPIHFCPAQNASLSLAGKMAKFNFIVKLQFALFVSLLHHLSSACWCAPEDRGSTSSTVSPHMPGNVMTVQQHSRGNKFHSCTGKDF
ncbi:hypothetical protein CHARACLAT_019614 [Characodon lateralis]|uniref:Secreted protein n=1 Tax=Characodon lateralis TaxID=208331 RepID=A0ABU7DI30_9TELE|nr:hypothetical protein [Characodon lateralis]